MDKNPVAHIIDSVGVKSITERIGVSEHAVRFARTERRFPAAWFDEIDALCRDAGVPCPRGLFNWKRRDEDKKVRIPEEHVNAPTKAQPQPRESTPDARAAS